MSNGSNPVVESGKTSANEQVKTEYNFQKLTPVQDASIDTYAAALDFAFENDDIRNIAITGTYGSGKSSVFETYEKKHNNLKFIHLSLAHFDNEDLQNKGNESEEKNIKTIEGQLLNQLINQIPPKNIPETQFRIKQGRNKKKYRIISYLISACALIVLCLLHRTEVIDVVLHIRFGLLREILLFFLKPDFIFFRLLLLSVPFAFVIYKLLYNLADKKFIQKINVKGNEIVLFSDQKDSFFDKYLNEILYLFEHSEADGVVFEDIDRFNNTLVFERLREINVLLHLRHQSEIEENEKAEKAKAIKKIEKSAKAEVVKKIKESAMAKAVKKIKESAIARAFNKRAAKAKAIKKIEEAAKAEVIKKIEEVAKTENKTKSIRFFYLIRDDLFNNTENKDRTKFFDFIIPIVPVVDGKNSYDKLSILLGEGFKKFDQRFMRHVCIFIDDYRVLKNIYNEYCIYDRELKNSELDCSKLFAIIVYKNIFPHDFAELQIKKGFVYTLLSDKTSIVKAYNKICDDKIDELYKINGGSGADEYLLHRIEEIQREKLPIQKHSVRDLIIIPNIEDAIEGVIELKAGEGTYKNIKNNPYYSLLTYLLGSGKIDETYSDYLSFFYQDNLSLTLDDKKYIRRVMERSESDDIQFDCSINDLDAIMDCLEDYDFTHKAVLNHQLFEHLLQNSRKYEKRNALKNMIQAIIDFKQYRFIREYICSHKDIEKAIDAINRYGGSTSWLFDSEMREDMLRFCVYKTLKTGSYEKWDDRTGLTNYLSHQTMYIDREIIQSQKRVDRRTIILSMKDKAGEEITKSDAPVIMLDETKAIKKGIADLKVQFDEIDDQFISKEFLEFIHNSNLYKINAKNIKLIVTECCNQSFDDAFLSGFMSFIFTQPYAFCEYMKNNIEDVLKIYLDVYKGEIVDSEDVIAFILNRRDSDLSKYEEYVKRLNTKVKNLDLIRYKDDCELLLRYRLVEYTGDNILHYYKKNKNQLDSVLRAFIESDTAKLTFSNNVGEAENIKQLITECSAFSIDINI